MFKLSIGLGQAAVVMLPAPDPFESPESTNIVQLSDDINVAAPPELADHAMLALKSTPSTGLITK